MVGGSNPPPGTRLLRRFAFGFLTAAAAALAPVAYGSPVPIADPSFEETDIGPGEWSHDLSPWEETGGPGSTDGFKEWIDGFVADGTNHLGMTAGHRVWQDLEATYEPDTLYTLTVAVGHRPGFTSSGNSSTFRLEDSDGAVYAEGEYDASTLDSGTFIDTSADFATGNPRDEIVGKTIRVVLTGGGAGRSHFDHVRLTTESLLPPEVPELGPVSGEALSARTAAIEGEVTFDGHEPPEITIVYGENDGETDLAAWEHQVSLGPQDGVFSAVVESLAPETGYFFRARAENSAGASWAPATESFTTPSVREPELGPLSGEALGARILAISGEITFYEHETPEVILAYGPADGGTQLEAWENQVSLGPQDGAFSVLIEDVAPETEYVFRARAQNIDGASWSAPGGPVTTPPPQPGRAVINEFHYKQVDKNVLEEFIELHNPGDTDVDLSGWEITTAVRYAFPQGTILPAGGYLVVAEDPDTMLALFGVDAIGPWDGALSSDGESIQLVDGDGEIHDRVDYGAGFPWPTAADGEGSSVELLHPDLDNVVPGHWRASGFGVSGLGEIAQPTPGAPNSVRAALDAVPPAIDRVAHRPRQPGSDDTVAVSARVDGPGLTSSVTLSYQIVEPGNYIRITDSSYETDWTDLSMSRNEAAGPGIFTLELPAELHEHRHLVRYRITAEDEQGNTQTVPYADDEQPNFAYYVYDEVPDWQGAFEPGETPLETYPSEFLETLPVYTLIADDQDIINSQYNGSFDGDRLPGTFVYNGVVYDHIRFRNRGQGSTYVAGKNKWRIHFNTSRRGDFHDNEGEPYREDWGFLTVNAAASPWAATNRGIAGVDEMLPFKLYQRAGMLSPHTHYFHFRVVRNEDEAPAPGTTHSDSLGTADGQYLSDFWGLYYAIEPIRGPFIRERNLPKGSIYQIEGGGTDKEYQGFGQPSDFSDWEEFRNTINSSPSKAWWEENFELESYYTFHALNRLLGNVDLRAENNYHLYHRPTDGRWVMIPWDLDMMFIAKSHWTASIGGTSYPGVSIQYRALIDHPELALQFRNRGREILDLVASDGSPDGGQIGRMIAYFSNIVAPEEPINWANADAAMWNWHPRTNGSPGNHSGQTNHLGNFFRTPFLDSRFGGEWTRWLRDPDFEGHAEHADFMDYIRDYVTNTWPGGTWQVNNGEQRGYGYQYLASEVADPDIPETPSITYTGEPDYPPNALSFEASSFEDPQGPGTYAATAWRIAEIGSPNPNELPAYEIEAVWESGERPDNSGISIPADTVEAGRTYRARVRHKDETGRWSHWSEPVEFTAGDPVPATLVHYWNFNDTERLLEPALTRTGGSLDAAPGAATEFTHSTGQEFEGENARLGDPAGSHFRVNNPLGAVLVFNLPTTGFENVVLRYETRRSRQGAGTQVVSVSTDGVAFSEFDRYPVFNETPIRKAFDFSSVPGAADNPDFAVRITFLQDDGMTAGNNRFDNVTLDGISIDGTKAPPTVAQPVGMTSIIAGEPETGIDLNAVFSDPDESPLVFSVASNRPSLASAKIEDATLRISGHAPGEAALTVSADDGVNPPVDTVVRALVFPAAHSLESGPFRFNHWDPDNPEWTYPAGMIFLQSAVNDPDLDTPLTRAYFIPEHEYASGDAHSLGFPYNNESRTRINGLGAGGISFINTGRGRDLGGAVAALDTRNIENAQIGFTAGTRSPNSRVYAIRLQYRIGAEGPFSDLVTPSGQVVEYLRAPTAGHEWSFGPIELPEDALGHDHVQLVWRYHHVDGENGPRAELRLDNLVVTTHDATEDGFEAWRAAHFPEWADFIDESVSGPAANRGGEGIANLLRYAFDLALDEPAEPHLPSLRTPSGENPRLRFRFDPGKDDIVWRVESSNDLFDWSHIVFDSGVDPPPPIDDGWVEVELPPASPETGSSGSRTFVRLKIHFRD